MQSKVGTGKQILWSFPTAFCLYVEGFRQKETSYEVMRVLVEPKRTKYS